MDLFLLFPQHKTIIYSRLYQIVAYEKREIQILFVFVIWLCVEAFESVGDLF